MVEFDERELGFDSVPEMHRLLCKCSQLGRIAGRIGRIVRIVRPFLPNWTTCQQLSAHGFSYSNAIVRTANVIFCKAP